MPKRTLLANVIDYGSDLAVIATFLDIGYNLYTGNPLIPGETEKSLLYLTGFLKAGYRELQLAKYLQPKLSKRFPRLSRTLKKCINFREGK